jgi:fatty-acyl-CoA synthase
MSIDAAPSQARGATEPPLLDCTIGEQLVRTASRFRDAEALVVPHQAVRWTWGELLARADAFAAGLLALGLERGDRVGIWAPNCAEWTVVQYATARAGLVLVNVNPAYRTFELEYALNKVGCRAVVLAPSLKSSDYLTMLAELSPELSACAPGALRSARLPTLQVVIRLGHGRTPGMLNFDEVPARATDADRDRLRTLGATLTPDDAINIQFTSGTTGAPKGATLSHRNILNNGYFTGIALGLTVRDRLCIPVPLYHCFGMVLGNLACLAHGAAAVYPAESFDARLTLETLATERCTAVYGVPTMFIAQLDHPDFATFDLTSLRTGMMAGSPCPIEVMKRVLTDMHLPEMTIGYGMTETSPISTQGARDDAVELRVSTVGRVQPHVEIRIVDPVSGATVPRGTPGEFCTRGYSVMLGYWDDEKRTREAIDADGWMHTGDLATMDANGYVNIVGRLKDMVIRGGENVYPREVEEFLYTHPDVLEVNVCGVPDAKYGEELCAWVRRRPGAGVTEEGLREFCRGRIAHFKVPRYVKFVESFPTTVTGKIQKFQMRKTMIDELRLTEQRTA